MVYNKYTGYFKSPTLDLNGIKYYDVMIESEYLNYLGYSGMYFCI